MSEHQIILEHLASDNPELVREAAFLAGEGRVEAAVPLLAKCVLSSNPGIQEAADMAIRQIGGHAAVQAVVPLLRSDDAPVRNIAMDVLREIGADDFPMLVQLLKDEDPDIRIFISDIMGTCKRADAVAPLCDALLHDTEVNVRYQAAVSLGVLGFVDAAPCLNKAMEDEEWVQFSVIEALTKIGADSSVEALAGALEHSSDLVASMIVDALGEMGNIKAVTVLMKHLDSAPGPLRNKIVKAIVQLLGAKSLHLLGDKERETFREYLLAAMNDEETDIQDAAMKGLGFVGGDKASKSILELATTFDADRDHERLLLAVDCLASIGFTPALENALRNGEEYAVLIAVEAISRMSGVDAHAVLQDVFWAKSRDEQRAIIVALSQVADESSKQFFLDVLERHNDGNVIKAALHYFGERFQDSSLADKIFALLEHPYDDVKESALDACIALGGESTIQRFKQTSQSPEPIQRMMAVYALGKLGVENNLEELTAALEDEVPDIRKVALEALFSVCPDKLDRLALVAPRLQDENREVRLALVELIGGCDSDDVVPYLVQALEDQDDWVRVRAIESLGMRGKRDSVQYLVPLLNEESVLIQLKAIESLGALGGKTAFRALLGLMDHQDPEIQAAVTDAAERIRQDEGENA